MKVNFKYVEPVDQDLKCKKCSEPAHDPLLHSDGSIECGECRVLITPDQNEDDVSSSGVQNYLKKQLNNLLVICENCDDKTPVSYIEFKNHKCSFKYKNEKCLKNYENQKELEKHAINDACEKEIIDNASNLKCGYFQSFCNFFYNKNTQIVSETTKKPEIKIKNQLYFNYKGRSIFQYNQNNINKEIPDDIESIAIGPGLKESFYIFCCKLPTTVTELFILEGYDYELYPGDMPVEIKTLHIYNYGHYLRWNSIGHGVTSLHFEDGFKENIYHVIYPPNLKSLYFYNTIHPFSGNNQTIKCTAQKIYFKDGYSHPIRYEIIKDFKTVSFGNIKQPLLKSFFTQCKARNKEIIIEEGYSHKNHLYQ